MLSRFELGHIEGAFQLAEQCELSDKTKNQIAYCRKLIKAEQDREFLRHASHYGSANGVPANKDVEKAQRLIDGIAADCDLHGCD